jgi:HSP20 family protein
MADTPIKLPVQTPARDPHAVSAREWRPFVSLRREIDRLFEDFDHGGGWGFPFRRSLFDFEPRWPGEAALAVDVAEKDRAYEITAELPGIDPNNIDVKLANGVLTIRGEKKQETEEKKKNYYVSERRYGSFERLFQVPDGVDAEKIEASFNKGVLTVTLPKSAEAQKSVKTIAVKAA